jgi:hypothetical protein
LRLGLAALLAAQPGCRRSYYRQQADRETYAAVAEVTANPRFVVPEFDITPDPRARFADPTDPDHPPMPPDDPDSHRYMHCVNGMRGAPGWHDDGDLPDVEFEGWQSALPANEKGEVVVDLAKVIELGRLHSRDYQSQLETLYLSALDVTFERFRFQTQFFGGNVTTMDAQGPVFAGGNSSSLFTTTNSLQAQRLFAGGGTLIAGIANSIVVQFAGPNSTARTSLLNFAITQPLAQFAGRAYNLERLTTVERALLANLRQFERYRQGFYIELTNQSAAGTGLTRLGGFFGGAGLSGFSGVGAGGFGRVGTFGAGGSGAVAGGQGTGAQGAGGFIGLLQASQGIRNQRAQSQALRDTWMQLQASYEAGRIDRFQTDFARQNYFSAQSVLINSIALFDTTLDAYKIELGLPPHLKMVVEDPTLDLFNFIDPESTRLQSDVSDVLEDLRAPAESDDADTRQKLVERVRALQDRSQEQREQVRKDAQKLFEQIPSRRRSLENLLTLPEVQAGDIDQRIIEADRPSREAQHVFEDLLAMDDDLQTLRSDLDEFAVGDQTTESFRTGLIQIATRLSNHVLELSLLQARARLNVIDLVHVELTEEEAFQTALCNRADWMNAKASLVDSWRRIRYNANPLKSNVTLSLSGNLGTVGNDPLHFKGTNGELFGGVSFDAPLTRVAERNVYRQALIDYQQQRRALMAFRDEISRGLRARLRQVRLNEINLELRREGVDVAINQVDLTRLNLNRPPKPAAVPGEVERASPTAALDAINALRFLLDNQNAFLSVWVNQEIQRVLLDYDLGTMRLDEHGMWVDPGPISPNTLPAADVELLEDGIPPDVEIPELTVPKVDASETP